MAIQYRYDSALNAVVTTVTGSVDAGEALANLQNVLDDDNVPPGFVDIVDLSSASEFALEASDAAEIVSLVSEIRTRKGVEGTTFFAPNDLSFGIAKMFEDMLEDLGMSVEIYRNWDELAKVVTRRLRDSGS